MEQSISPGFVYPIWDASTYTSETHQVTIDICGHKEFHNLVLQSWESEGNPPHLDVPGS